MADLSEFPERELRGGEEFTREFLAAEPKLRAFALACGLGLAEVDDLVQDAAVILWRRFGEYDRSRSFLAWSIGVARNLVRKAMRDRAKQSSLSDDVLEKLSETCLSMDQELDRARHALEDCLEKLPARSREVFRLRYVEALSLAEIASRLGRTLSAVNMALRRMRFALLDCVEKTMGTGP